MIPRAVITEWGRTVPWPTVEQVEQDLVLSRLIVEIANDDYLGDELVFRGGTCLHKLHAPEPFRYSEDLDYVRSTGGGIRELTRAVTRIGDRLGMEVRTRITEHPKMFLRAPYETGGGQMRIKIEVNTFEEGGDDGRVAFGSVDGDGTDRSVGDRDLPPLWDLPTDLLPVSTPVSGRGPGRVGGPAPPAAAPGEPDPCRPGGPDRGDAQGSSPVGGAADPHRVDPGWGGSAGGLDGSSGAGPQRPGRRPAACMAPRSPSKSP